MREMTRMGGGARREYSELLQFARAHNGVCYPELDALTLKGMRLFDVPKDEYFKLIEDSLDHITRALPAIRHIFARPIIRLRDTQEIVPVEMANIINSQTLAHAAVHSEMWEDVTEEGIKPRRLMTVGRVETYAVYENMVFVQVVDGILQILSRMEETLKDVLYNSREMHFNLLDRTHHAAFFLALGKLYAEYVSAQDFQYASYFRCIEKIHAIDRALRPKLHAPVYVQCKKKFKRVAIKRTNAFRTHKDYREIWRLAKWMETELSSPQTQTPSETDDLAAEYRCFCSMLSVFSAGHFNFAFPKTQSIDFEHLDARASFMDWRLSVKSVHAGGLDGLLFEIDKDTPYRICLILSERRAAAHGQTAEFKGAVEAEEYLFANDTEYGERDVVYLSLFNIDSFRRIQQLLLRGMIYADAEHGTCPFCGNATTRTETAYECPICNGEIAQATCPETGEDYWTSGIREFRFSGEAYGKRTEYRSFLHDRYLEASLHFRNITPLSPDGTPTCPRCGRRHG